MNTEIQSSERDWRMRSMSLVLGVLVAVSLAGCSGGYYYEPQYYEPVVEPVPPPPPPPATTTIMYYEDTPQPVYIHHTPPPPPPGRMREEQYRSHHDIEPRGRRAEPMHDRVRKSPSTRRTAPKPSKSKSSVGTGHKPSKSSVETGPKPTKPAAGTDPKPSKPAVKRTGAKPAVRGGKGSRGSKK